MKCPDAEVDCPRVQEGIECPECGYPPSEALWILTEQDGPHLVAVDGFGGEIMDPGHKNNNKDDYERKKHIRSSNTQ